MGEEARAAAREAATVGKTVMEMTREMKIKGLQSQTGIPATYAAVAARGSMPAGIQNTQSLRVLSVQTQRKVVVNIRNALTIQSPRAMNPRNLKAYVERALE
ncbi:hypothetical protein K469DRAFT_770724 [Zopfia rhizophila CBS 207.26]|uniref:Uncharacterized protein n=1 Tax=Zopfia rhizophila CBS 207.26 TaxID=1314779 RepID=A0A6A6E6M1_9PEZI|nr:hypothetical protein K469DRAFT_770724 [Zopfia rhizophila CBS 207.26]